MLFNNELLNTYLIPSFKYWSIAYASKLPQQWKNRTDFKDDLEGQRLNVRILP